MLFRVPMSIVADVWKDKIESNVPASENPLFAKKHSITREPHFDKLDQAYCL